MIFGTTNIATCFAARKIVGFSPLEDDDPALIAAALSDIARANSQYSGPTLVFRPQLSVSGTGRDEESLDETW